MEYEVWHFIVHAEGGYRGSSKDAHLAELWEHHVALGADEVLKDALLALQGRHVTVLLKAVLVAQVVHPQRCLAPARSIHLPHTTCCQTRVKNYGLAMIIQTGRDSLCTTMLSHTALSAQKAHHLKAAP